MDDIGRGAIGKMRSVLRCGVVVHYTESWVAMLSGGFGRVWDQDTAFVAKFLQLCRKTENMHGAIALEVAMSNQCNPHDEHSLLGEGDEAL